MTKISFKGVAYDCSGSETVLQTLRRHDVAVSYSCTSGICHTCLLRSRRGLIPETAQRGLKDTLRQRGYFLACLCVPQCDMELAPPRDVDLFGPAVVHRKERLAPNICRLLLETATTLDYQAGQFINLRRTDGLMRSYSLASIAQQDYFLELHVKRMLSGRMSNWIFDHVEAGDEIDVQGPNGTSYYMPGQPNQNLLLIGSGTGLAPILGIARDALDSGHRGNIYLFHGSRHAHGLYLQDSLYRLAERHTNLHYTPCVSGRDVPAGYAAGRAHDIAFAKHSDLTQWRIFLCGAPPMVHAAQKAASLAGASLADIYSHPFEVADLRRKPRDALQHGDSPKGRVLAEEPRVLSS